MVECTVCGVEIKLVEDTVIAEVISCDDCGSDLEVTGINPFTIEEAPQADEDWGE